METNVKRALICKGIESYSIDTTMVGNYLPVNGDVALFRVREIGKHNRLQNDDGKNRYLFPGDFILCAFGNRYATNQIEGYVPDRQYPEYHILGQGGVVGVVRSMFKPLEAVGPTTLELIGYAVNVQGRVVNTIQQHAARLRAPLKPIHRPRIILSLGTSMDSGKTTTAGYLCRGLSQVGRRVAYMKLTGTIFGKDPGFAYDCGACSVTDFSRFGYPSTYLAEENELLLLFQGLLNELNDVRPDDVVVEIADGLLQRETAMLLRNQRFASQADAVIFSAGDSLGVVSGLQILKEWGIIPFAVSGCFTMSPLLINEVQAHCTAPVLTLEGLESPEILEYLDGTMAPADNRIAHVA